MTKLERLLKEGTISERFRKAIQDEAVRMADRWSKGAYDKGYSYGREDLARELRELIGAAENESGS